MIELIIPLVMFFFSLITHLLDIVLILLGEILSKPPLGVKRLTTNFKIYNALKVLKIVLTKEKKEESKHILTKFE